MVPAQYHQSHPHGPRPADCSFTESFVAAQDDPKATQLTSVGTLKQAGVPVNLGIAYAFYADPRPSSTRPSPSSSRSSSHHRCEANVVSRSRCDDAAGWKPTQAYKWIVARSTPTPRSQPLPIPILPALPLINENSPSSYLELWHNARAFINQHLDVLESSFLFPHPRAHHPEQRRPTPPVETLSPHQRARRTTCTTFQHHPRRGYEQFPRGV